MTRTWAREFGRHRIRVNALAPGLIQTDFSAYFWQDESRRHDYLSEQPISRLGQPEDIANVALFLASDESRMVNGAAIPAEGGFSAY